MPVKGNGNARNKTPHASEVRRLILVRAIPLLALLLYSNCSYAEQSPSGVVAEYCRHDTEGYRLSSESYEKIAALMSNDEDLVEPGWDCFKAIRKYEIVRESITNEQALVTVNYSLLSEYCVGGSIKKEDSIDTFQFRLRNENGHWKILNYPPFPRLRANKAVEYVKKIDGSELSATFQDSVSE
ncbi:MAG: hypothetical protein K9M17_07425 [Mariprofundaceae bacterium]|nr:hypothetical protein [Mariprofundaceae bacterium]